MSKLPIIMAFKCTNCCKILFDRLRLSFDAANKILMCKIGIKWQFASRAVFAYAYVFFKTTRVCAYWSMCAN